LQNATNGHGLPPPSGHHGGSGSRRNSNRTLEPGADYSDLMRKAVRHHNEA
jgi:hypothetical protein